MRKAAFYDLHKWIYRYDKVINGVNVCYQTHIDDDDKAIQYFEAYAKDLNEPRHP